MHQHIFSDGNIEEAEVFYSKHGVPFNADGFRRLRVKHDGNLPIIIKAVPDGTVVPTNNVLMTVESTDPEFFWIVGFVETLLMRMWYPITVATQSFMCKTLIKRFLDLSSDDPNNEVVWKLHDFGARGVSSHESAAIG